MIFLHCIYILWKGTAVLQQCGIYPPPHPPIPQPSKPERSWKSWKEEGWVQDRLWPSSPQGSIHILYILYTHTGYSVMYLLIVSLLTTSCACCTHSIPAHNQLCLLYSYYHCSQPAVPAVLIVSLLTTSCACCTHNITAHNQLCLLYS